MCFRNQPKASMMNKLSYLPQRIAQLVTVGLIAVFLAGCGTVHQPVTPSAPVRPAGPDWSFFDGATGEALNWEEVKPHLLAADIILVGEQHDDVLGHQLEALLTDALLEAVPNAAIAMEMFERNEQGFVDLFLEDRIQAATLVNLTDSANWGGGKNTWMQWYQPIVDHVKARRSSGAALIAANAPRSYVRLARLEGFEVLQALEGDAGGLFETPDLGVDDSAYRERFEAMMRPHPLPEPTVGTASEQESDAQANAGAAAHSSAATSMDTAAFFRAQQVWDATMAASVAQAAEQHPKVMLFVGEFHVGSVGGTTLRVQQLRPQAIVRTLSILRSPDPGSFNPTDLNRADIVAYTRSD